MPSAVLPIDSDAVADEGARTAWVRQVGPYWPVALRPESNISYADARGLSRLEANELAR